MDNNDNGFLTVEEAAKRIRVHPQTIYVWLQDGKFPGTKINGVWRICKSDIDAFFEKEKGSTI